MPTRTATAAPTRSGTRRGRWAACTRRTSRRSGSATSRRIEGIAARAETGCGSRSRDRALRREGHDHRTLGDDGHPARRTVPVVSGRVPARDRRTVRGGDRPPDPRQRARVGDGDHRGAGGGAPPHGGTDRVHERRLRLPDRDAQGRRPAPDAVRVEPRRATAADGSAHGRQGHRPAVRGPAGSVRAFARAAGLRRAASGPDGARPPPSGRRAGVRGRQDPRHLLRPGDHARAGTRIRTITGSS